MQNSGQDQELANQQQVEQNAPVDQVQVHENQPNQENVGQQNQQNQAAVQDASADQVQAPVDGQEQYQVDDTNQENVNQQQFQPQDGAENDKIDQQMYDANENNAEKDNQYEQEHYAPNIENDAVNEPKQDAQDASVDVVKKQRKIRELGYISTENIINKNGQNNLQLDSNLSRDKSANNQQTQQMQMQNLQKSVTRENFQSYIDKLREDRDLSQKQLRWNLDSLKMPQSIQEMFPNKVRLFDQMRNFEKSINDFMKAKTLNVKEDLLNNQTHVRRLLKMMVEIDTTEQTDGNWKLRVEGRILDERKESDILDEDQNSTSKYSRFLDLFQKVRVEFTSQNPQQNDQEEQDNDNTEGGQKYQPEKQCYLPVNWSKTKSDVGSAFDCLQIVRNFRDGSGQLQDVINVKIQMHLEHNPKRFKLSSHLHEVLGIEEETRVKIIGALWQYIKSNRLQDQENRKQINLNSELSEVFGGHDKIEFHQIISMLREHLSEPDPIVLNLKVNREDNQRTRQFFQLPVNVHSSSQKEQIEFLVQSSYDFFGEANVYGSASDPTNRKPTKLGLLGTQLKKRETKQNTKIAQSIEKMKRTQSHLKFYEQMSQGEIHQQIANLIIKQNEYLKILQEEPVMTQVKDHDGINEHEHAQFYVDNQDWLLGEVSKFLKNQKEEEKELLMREQNQETENNQMDEDGDEDNEAMEQEQANYEEEQQQQDQAVNLSQVVKLLKNSLSQGTSATK